MDSRARKPKGLKTFNRHLGVLLYGEPVYCVSCGHQSKWSRVTHVDRDAGPLIFICTSTESSCGCNCEGRFGRPEEMFTKVSEEEVERSYRDGMANH